MGNARGRRFASARLPVHPHVCGERISRFINIMPAFGSSPRVWGTPPRLILSRPLQRFIPTCVGNAGDSFQHFYSLPVHPHVCGERDFVGCEIDTDYGSSPRVWGTHKYFSTTFSAFRFIPTCVGNASYGCTSPVAIAVHPHVCGERNTALFFNPRRVGSSPRVWGTLCCAPPGKLLQRFIPTCVGNAG